MADVYIHYGATEYHPEQVGAIRNRPGFAKPEGGLWASRINAAYGWKQWCEENEFRTCDESEAFWFTLDAGARVLLIGSVDDVDALPRVESVFSTPWVCLDFEQLAAEYDVIDIRISGDYRLYDMLYGVDCDCILVVNPDVVVPS